MKKITTNEQVKKIYSTARIVSLLVVQVLLLAALFFLTEPIKAIIETSGIQLFISSFIILPFYFTLHIAAIAISILLILQSVIKIKQKWWMIIIQLPLLLLQTYLIFNFII